MCIRDSSQTAWGVEAKWATELADGFSIGAKADSVWAANRQPRYQGMSASALASWKAGKTVALHLNLGRDFIHAGDDQSRYGASVEWAPVQPWSLVAERYK